MSWKVRRKTTHVKIYYKDGSVYNIRRALVVGCRVPSRLRIKVTSNPIYSYLGVKELGQCKSYRLSEYAICKKYIEKVEQTYKDGSMEVVFDHDGGLRLDLFLMGL
jgi:hypothetical protein